MSTLAGSSLNSSMPRTSGSGDERVLCSAGAPSRRASLLSSQGNDGSPVPPYTFRTSDGGSRFLIGSGFLQPRAPTPLPAPRPVPPARSRPHERKTKSGAEYGGGRASVLIFPCFIFSFFDRVFCCRCCVTRPCYCTEGSRVLPRHRIRRHHGGGEQHRER